MMRKLIIGVAALALGIVGVGSAIAQEEPQSVIAITGTRAILDGNTLSIEGVADVLPLIYFSTEPQDNTYYPTADLKTDWGFAYQIVNDPDNLPQPADVELTQEQVETSATLNATAIFREEAVDFKQALTLTNPNFDEENGVLSFEVEVGDLTVSVNKATAPADGYEQFVLYVNLTPEFLSGLRAGAAYADEQGRASGARRCRPRPIRC